LSLVLWVRLQLRHARRLLCRWELLKMLGLSVELLHVLWRHRRRHLPSAWLQVRPRKLRRGRWPGLACGRRRRQHLHLWGLSPANELKLRLLVVSHLRLHPRTHLDRLLPLWMDMNCWHRRMLHGAKCQPPKLLGLRGIRALAQLRLNHITIKAARRGSRAGIKRKFATNVFGTCRFGLRFWALSTALTARSIRGRSLFGSAPRRRCGASTPTLVLIGPILAGLEPLQKRDEQLRKIGFRNLGAGVEALHGLLPT